MVVPPYNLWRLVPESYLFLFQRSDASLYTIESIFSLFVAIYLVEDQHVLLLDEHQN